MIFKFMDALITDYSKKQISGFTEEEKTQFYSWVLNFTPVYWNQESSYPENKLS